MTDGSGSRKIAFDEGGGDLWLLFTCLNQGYPSDLNAVRHLAHQIEPHPGQHFNKTF